jgi:hypothetical protein
VFSRITARNAVISETHIFSPTLINEAKLGFNRNWILRSNLRTNTNFDPQSVGLIGILAGLGSINDRSMRSRRLRADGDHRLPHARRRRPAAGF